MTEPNSTPSGAPGNTPSINPAPAPPEMSGPSSFVRTRAAQMAQTMTPTPSDNAPAPQRTEMPPQENPRSRGHSPALDARRQQRQPPAPGETLAADAPQQQQPPAEQKVYGDHTATEIDDALAFKAEADIRKNTLPKTEAEYLARNSESFKLPEGVKFEFNENDSLLTQARKIALARGLDQETFSSLLDLHVSSKIGELTNQATMRTRNLDALGAAGPQRIDAVATWLKARAGDNDGVAVANFLKQFPSAPMVRTFERLIRQFSSQGNTDYSGQHRETVDANAGKIPGYSEMSFAQKRAVQMAERMRTDPNYARGVKPTRE